MQYVDNPCRMCYTSNVDLQMQMRKQRVESIQKVMMKTVIVGGTGVIGRALSAELRTSGHQVSVLTRNPTRASDLQAQATVIPWDGVTMAEWVTHITGADAVVNLAGENLGAGLWTPSRKRRIRESRTRVGSLLVQAIAQGETRPSVLIQASAVGYYGPRDNHPIDETASPGQGWLPQVAVAWEDSTQPVEALGVRRTVIRTGLVLASRGGLLSRLMLPFRFFAGGRLGSGRQTFSWIHIDDEVRAIRFLIEHPTASGAFNLTAPNPVTNAAFSRILGTVMRRPAWLPVPALAIRLVLGEMSQLALTGQHVVPERLLNLGFSFEHPDLEAALASLLQGHQTRARHAQGTRNHQAG